MSAPAKSATTVNDAQVFFISFPFDSSRRASYGRLPRRQVLSAGTGEAPLGNLFHIRFRFVLPRLVKVLVDLRRLGLLSRRQKFFGEQKSIRRRFDPEKRRPGVRLLDCDLDGPRVADPRESPDRGETRLRVVVGGGLPKRLERIRIREHAERRDGSQPLRPLQIGQRPPKFLRRARADRKERLGRVL